MRVYSDLLTNDAVVIFLLHGVIHQQTHLVRNYTQKHITSDNFYFFLKDLSHAGTPLSMHDVFEYVTKRKPFPAKSFVISFDDGFENNFSIARPLLRQFSIPAIFYVTTDFIENNHMSWIDRIEYVVELSNGGSVSVGEKQWSFTRDAASKRHFLDQLRQALKWAKHINLEDVATSIQAQLNFQPISSSNDPLDKKMSWAQVAALHADSLSMIGGHTHTHPVLANLSDVDSEAEITHSLRLIDEKIGLKCSHYSYPEGLSHCYTGREINFLKKHGVICCPSAIAGINTLGSDLFHLKRVFVV